MSTTQTEGRTKLATSRNTRRNEIIAIALFAAGLLLALCLASYNPNDASWNTAGAGQARNLAGAFGANVSAALLQIVGLAAYLVPLLLFAAAWRRFRTRRLRAPLSRVVGLLLIVLAVSSLLALFQFSPLFDKSVEPGGVMGALVAQTLANIFNTIGASVLLLALAAAGLLLATNFSFIRLYERVATSDSNFFHNFSARFKEWRGRRQTHRQQQAEMRRDARAGKDTKAAKDNTESEKTGAERVAEFMRETSPAEKPTTTAAAEAINRSALHNEPVIVSHREPARVVDDGEQVYQGAASAPASNTTAQEATAAPQLAAAAAAANYSASRSVAPAIDETDDIEAMMDSVPIVRTLTNDEAPVAEVESKPDKKRHTEKTALRTNYELPGVEFLNAPTPRHEQADDELKKLGVLLKDKCKEFNVTGELKHICPGPVVTTYEFKPDPGVKYSRVTGLVDDLCLALKAESIRIDRVPGKAHVGIEVPNPQRETISMREVIESRAFHDSESKLTLALGKTIDGLNYVADLAKMPHLLIAGATGAGKSVCLNSLVVSILYKATPDEVKFIMVDPKRLELGLYADIPHLATPIITEPKRAANSLKWAVKQMEDRYRQLAMWSVRNIDSYNAEVRRRNIVEDYDDEGNPHKPLPYLVIIIDELADLMMVSGHEVEESITRLAQMARAVGIHLVLATQRPSVDVITGLIKANFPSRISFRVSSKVDSRTIIDANGAEQLLGRGDMLFLPPGTSRLVRVHGAYLDETEVARVVGHVKTHGKPAYDETITQSEDEATNGNGANGEQDELFEQALRICVEMKRASTSVLQRRLRIGYGRAAAILDQMERDGMIGPVDGARPRPVLGRAFETIAHWESVEEI
ncbi:MAG: DNA translocase FtsK [Pyrinomonadaceae bacterium]